MNSTTKDIVAKTFLKYFEKEFPLIELTNNFFPNEEICIKYFKKVIYFKKAVIEPLESNGMEKTDKIVDLACGDGQMSLALYLLGYTNVTLFDMDSERIAFAKKIIQFFVGTNISVPAINDSAGNMKDEYDVIISYQTIEHLSDTGNYSEASRRCQKDFLNILNVRIKKLIYINAPNYTYPIDGHDTGKLFFHFLPINIRHFFIRKMQWVKCSWAGISQPVSVLFLNRYLANFKLQSNYYAFNSMESYMKNYPPFDYMGNPYYEYDQNKLPAGKKTIKIVSSILKSKTQYILPVLSVIYKRVH